MDGRLHTWNYHGLTTHDKNGLHGSEFADAQLLAHLDGKAQLDDEDGTEEADAHGDDDVGGTLQVRVPAQRMEIHDTLGGYHGQDQAESHWSQGHGHGDG